MSGNLMDHSHSVSIPRLETERLVLRAYRRADFDAFVVHFAAHFADPPGADDSSASTRGAAWRIFCSHAGLWTIDGAGWWAVEERQTGQLVGTVGAFFREDCMVMELGWNTYSAFGGRGYACEAAAGALKYAFDIRQEAKVRALIAPGNASSLRVASRLGFRYESEAALNGKAIGSYTLER